ncbi:MAG: hypothetical protein RL414_916 [Actinomycetota bacterium]
MSTRRYITVERMGDVRRISKEKYPVTCGLIVDGFAEDAVTSIQSIKKFAPADTCIAVLASGDFDVAPLAEEIDDRTILTHIKGGVGWGEAANNLLKFSPSPIMILMDPSTIFTGDAITPVMKTFEEDNWSVIGWHGGLINVEDEWRSVDDKGPGEVDVIFSYFMAMKVEDALGATGFNIRAHYYRNADIEFSLRVRQGYGRLLQMDLPLEQGRHHGYHDTDPEYRDAQSKKTYDRILDRFRGKNEILVPRR